MTLEYLLFANLILLPRLLYLSNDGPLGWRLASAVALGQALLGALCFAWNGALLAMVLTVLACGAIDHWGVRSGGQAGPVRLSSLLLLLTVPPYLGALGDGFVLAPRVALFADHLCDTLPPVASLCAADVRYLGSLLFGLLLLANETNIAVRTVFHRLGLEPREPAGQGDPAIDAREYRAGRVIGILERWLMFIVVLWTDDLSALAFIIAAKGLARMKQLEDRQFAEYMLVGTLLSALAAIAVGAWIRQLW